MADHELTSLKAEVHALRKVVAAMAARLTVLERPRGPRDGQDHTLLLAITDAAEGLPFKAGDIITRAESVPVLADALLHADIDNAKQLGKLLARLVNTEVDGIRIDRVSVRGKAHWVCVSVSAV